MIAIGRAVKSYASLVKIEHALFALPFALTSSWVCCRGAPPLDKLGWIVLAVLSARSAAMAFNRIVDLPFDRLNPRTAQRDLPTGRLTVGQAGALVVFSALIFFFSAYQLNRLAFLLSFPALAWLLGYSFSKRFTILSHLWLGTCLGLAPVGAWVGLKGEIGVPSLWLMAAVTFWVTGFDILYATLDIAFDRKTGLFSLPARMGLVPSLWVARISHFLFVVCLTLFGLWSGLSLLFWIGFLISSALILIEHWVADPADPIRINTAFFTVNAIVSSVIFFFTVLDIHL
ncbi:MAG: putative 4-hydroxybenzoate polyprenyltransferase [Armatimonadetes bacterium]|nr:putative 4-hydroxybenzoate polyprenyltransferase [Armatimonadota bacterium]MDW8120962.1 UbiA-like polyprenyltransferase [Armatimonadota bacterium]